MTWKSNGTGGYTSSVFGTADSSWHFEGTGDFNGDGVADLLGRNKDGGLGTWNSNTAGGFDYT